MNHTHRAALGHALGATATLATPVLPLSTIVTIIVTVGAAAWGASLAAWCLTFTGPRANRAINFGGAVAIGLFFAAGAAEWIVIVAATGSIVGTLAVIAVREELSWRSMT